jgi:hypothetical protein
MKIFLSQFQMKILSTTKLYNFLVSITLFWSLLNITAYSLMVIKHMALVSVNSYMKSCESNRGTS